jgi:hypothetical protein
MRLVSGLLATFALGLIATGIVTGLLPAGSGGCGAAFSSGKEFTEDGGCPEARAQRRALPVTLLGLGITTGVAAAVANGAARESERARSRSSA